MLDSFSIMAPKHSSVTTDNPSIALNSVPRPLHLPASLLAPSYGAEEVWLRPGTKTALWACPRQAADLCSWGSQTWQVCSSREEVDEEWKFAATSRANECTWTEKYSLRSLNHSWFLDLLTRLGQGPSVLETTCSEDRLLVPTTRLLNFYTRSLKILSGILFPKRKIWLIHLFF